MIDELVYLVDLQADKVLFCNRRLKSMLGWNEVEQGDSVTSFISRYAFPEDRAEVLSSWEVASSAEMGTVHTTRTRWLAADGHIKVLECSKKIISKLESGEPHLAMGKLKDVDESVRLVDRLDESEQKLSLALEGSGVAVWHWNHSEKAIDLSDIGKKMLGYEVDEVFGPSDWLESVHPDELDEVRQAFLENASGRTNFYVAEYRMRHRDGHYIWVYDRGFVASRAANGSPLITIGTKVDVSARREAEEKNRQALEVKRAILSALPDSMYRFNADGIFLDCFATSVNLLSQKPHELIGSSLLDIFPNNQALQCVSLIKHTLASNSVQVSSIEFDDGTNTRYFELRFAPAGKDEVLAILRDVTLKKRLEDEITEKMLQLNEANIQLEYQAAILEEVNIRLMALATTDGLTGLKNHRAFQEQLEQECKRIQRYGGSLSLLMLDVDHFKDFNDAFGHPEGDRVLKMVATCIANVVRSSDVAARYGGEEFGIILPETDCEGALKLAERLRLSIESIEGLPRKVTISMGVAFFTPAIEKASDLVAAADNALYEAKRNGRNQVMFAA